MSLEKSVYEKGKNALSYIKNIANYQMISGRNNMAPRNVSQLISDLIENKITIKRFYDMLKKEIPLSKDTGFIKHINTVLPVLRRKFTASNVPGLSKLVQDFTLLGF